MEQDAAADEADLLNDFDERPRSAVNSVVLDYYKRFGRKRDLEQYFSLSTAQSDIRDPRSLFWRRMKEQSDTSDSGEKKSESSNEICRISIKCSIPDTSGAEKGDSQSNNDSESPPIITDVQAEPSGDESIDDNTSQKSADGTLDTSINKPLSPTSSITSQRKLDWDSLADVGYANESDRKASASSLSTLEREILAQKQQFTLDYKQSSDLGLPTAHSTPVDPSDGKSKGKKGQEKKTISISRKDIDFVEVSVPHDIEKVQPINVNLTKQFSVNLQRDGGMTVDNIKKDITISPERNVAVPQAETGVKMDKEIQTSLLRSKQNNPSPADCLEGASTSTQKAPILICLNTLRRMHRRKKMRKTRTKLKSKKKVVTMIKIKPEKDKSGEQVSEAESFEYMPGHIYNQNQLKQSPNETSNNDNNNTGNKSSLESSAVHTTDSSKESKYSFGKDLDKTLNVLKTTLKEKYDPNLKKKLVTEIIQRLLKSNYGDGETTPAFLSDLSLPSKKTLTTSTSEADNSEEKVVHPKPKKSILRAKKFDSNDVASSSQSAPNIPSVVNSDKPVLSCLSKIVSSTATETDLSNDSAKDGTSSDTKLVKMSSDELYKKYIDALKKEEAYKQHLRDKQLFLRQKLVRSENALRVPMQLDVRTNAKLKELIKDLTRNNYDDGSGDASKLEGGSSSNFDINVQRVPRKHRSHSVFTLSSGNSEAQNQNRYLKNRIPKGSVCSPRAGPSNWVGNLAGTSKRPAVTDSSVQVNINAHDKLLQNNLPNVAEVAKYVCYCTEKTPVFRHRPDEILTYECPITKRMTKLNAPYVINQPVCGLHAASSSLEDDRQTTSSSGHNKKQKIIHECTRCLQTKISIHPKISDPSVTDLNIVHSAECVKLINELYRKVSQTSWECLSSNVKDDCTSTTCKSSKDLMRRCGSNERDKDYLDADENEMAPLTDPRIDDKNDIENRVGGQKTFKNQPEDISDNIVIPIQGTNMMLKVSIGGKTMKVKDDEITKGDHYTNALDREINTDKIKTSLKGTSILEECSKSVQAGNADYIKNPVDAALSIKKDDNPPGNSVHRGHNIDTAEFRKTDNVFKSTALRGWGFSTYPKTVKISDKKPLIRSKTDTGKLEASSAIQTDTIYNKEKETESCFRADTKQVLAPGKESKSGGDSESQSQGIQNTPSEQSASSSGDIFKSSNILRNKHSTDQKKSIEIKGRDAVTDEGEPKDFILGVIKDITNRYSKKDTDKRNKKKCFKEIITALSYLLDTDDSGDGDQEQLTKESPRSKKVQRSREPSPQSDLVANHFPNVKARKHWSSYEKGENVRILAEHQSDKFVNDFPQRSMSNEEYDENMTTEALERDSETNICSNKSEDTNSNVGLVVEPEQAGLIYDKGAIEKTCQCGCGVADYKECMASLSAGCSSKESSKLKNQKLTYNSNKKIETGTSSKKTLNRKHDSKCSSPKKVTKKVTTCDKGCGCDGSSKCKDCVASQSSEGGAGTCGKNSATFKIKDSTFNSAKGTKTTCDRGCGCDGSKECKDCVGPHSPKDGISARGKDIVTSKNNESRCSSAKGTKTTCDRGCGCDGSKECKDCIGPHSPRDGIGARGKDFPTSKNKESKCNSAKGTTTTCDRGCGCDGSKECKDCVESHSPRDRTGAWDKYSATFKNQDLKRSSAKGTITTCDKCCGCDGSKECKDCIEPHSPKYKTGKCGKESEKSRKQERSTSPTKAKTTCDRACGCDGSSECTECEDTHSSSYGFGKCDKTTLISKKQDRCISPIETKTTCDKGCGCDGTAKCIECNHKTGRCAKETSRVKKQVSCNSPKKFVNRCMQSTVKRVKSLYSHYDDTVSTDPPCCSTDSPTAELVNKIKKECDKYQKRCKSSCKKCEASSSTTVSCDHCKRARHDHCRRHRCSYHKNRSTERVKKKCVAYNLIVQTSDSIVSEEIDKCRPLQNIIVRVPKCKGNMTFKEACTKIEQKLPYCSTSFEPKARSQTWPNECGISSTDDVKMAKACTVRDYLEKNRPEFVDRCATRQNCIRMTSEARTKESSKLREQLVGLESLPSLNKEELLYLAMQLGLGRRRHLQQQIMSEREMKKHSEKIYKKLPEVIQKKEEVKKESIKKTNLLMANIFKRNLQKKTLNGNVNISTYSQVVKI